MYVNVSIHNVYVHELILGQVEHRGGDFLEFAGITLFGHPLFLYSFIHGTYNISTLLTM